MTEPANPAGDVPVIPVMGSERHHSTRQIAHHFRFEHLPPGLQLISMHCALLAGTMIRKLPDSPELTAGLRKLLEAKDCFVRAALPPPDET